MAHNGYRQQQWQQQAPPTTQRNPKLARLDPRGYNDYGQPPMPSPQPPSDVRRLRKEHRPPPQQQYSQGYQDGYEEYNAQQYDQHHQQSAWQEETHQDHPQYDDRPYPDPRFQQQPQQPQQQPQARNYQYDDRFRNNGQGSTPPLNHQVAMDSKPPQEKHRPAPLPEVRKQKPKERILQQRTSPKTLMWDNPFGAFPPKPGKKEKDHHRHASLDQAVNDMNLGVDTGQQPGQRPHTSQGNRRQPDTSRPNTSHGHHRPDPPPESPRLPVDGQMPLRKPAPPSQLRDGPPARPPAFEPPVTQPSPQLDDSQFREYGGVDPYGYDRQGQGPPGAFPQQQPDQMQQALEHGRGYVEPRRQPIPEQQQQQQDSYRGVPLHKPISNGSNHAPQIQTHSEMPNFEAISPQVDENHFESSPQLHEQPAYAKKSYQAFAPIDTKPKRPPPPQAVESPLSDFQFGLQHQTSNQSAPPPPVANGLPNNPAPSRRPMPTNIAPVSYDNPPRMNGPSRYDSPVSPQQYNPPLSPKRDRYEQQRTFDPRIHKRRPSDQRRNPASRSQFPPRGASRPEPQHRSTSDGYVDHEDSGYWQASPEKQPRRPNTSQTQRRAPPVRQNSGPSNGHRNGHRGGYDQGYNPDYGYDQGPSDDRYQEQYDFNNPQYPDQHYGSNYQAPSSRGPMPPQNFSPAQSRPPTSGSGHPVPVRNYGNRTSSDAYRELPPSVNGGVGDRPPPIRPGLVPGSAQSPPPSQQMQLPPPQQRAQPRTQQEPASKQAPVTVAELNSMRETFKNNPNDYALGLRFAKRLVEGASVLATEEGRADPKQAQKNRERYIFDATKVVKRLCAQGYPDAMFYLADCYGQGLLGLAPDPKEAFALYQSAAKLNHPQSAYRVAVCCELGLDDGGGTRRDPMKSMQWYLRAAKLGDTPAMYKMGMILLKGLLGQQKDSRQAVSWLKRAAERANKDNPHALHELGLLYESAQPNDHIIKDERYALQLFTQAADLGYKYSQFRLGSAFEYGLLGVMIDPRQSIGWYTKAASQGEHQSELALSGWYLTGCEGLLQQSDTEAYLWARKAASSGLAKAEYAMGYFCETGIGTSVDGEESKRWYYRAAAQNMTKAKDRLEALKRGGPKQQKTRISRSQVGEGKDDCVVM